MDPSPEVMHDLRKIPCLAGLNKEDIATIGERVEIKNVTQNQILFTESDSIGFFFIVRQGAIKLFKSSKKGKELVVRVMGPGDYFCCAPVLDKCKSLVSAMAVEDSTLITIPEDHFKKILFGNMNDFGRRLITGLCKRVKYLSDLVGALTFKDVEERVMVSLLRLAIEESPDERIVPLRVTHHDIASMTGTVREVVSRIMAKLKKEGVITDSGIRGFKVDRDRLAEILAKKYHK